MSRIKMGDGVEYVFWALTPLAAKEKRVKASLAFLQDYIEGDAVGRITRDVKRLEKEESRIDEVIRASQWIMENADAIETRYKALEEIKGCNTKATTLSDEIRKLQKKGDDITDRANTESKFITVWMLQQDPNKLKQDHAEAITTSMNCLEPVKVILGFGDEEDEKVPDPLGATSTS